MKATVPRLVALFSLVAVELVLSEPAGGDGGAVQAITRAGPFQISVFTSPNPLVAGPVDVSVLVQDAQSLATVSAAEVSVTLAPRGRPYAAETHPATTELATNKLFRDCHVELAAGAYEVSVEVRQGNQRITTGLIVDVGPAPTRASAFWPWYTWPVVPIMLLLAHLYCERRRPGRAAAKRKP